MDWFFFQALVLFLVYFVKVSTQQLGSSCTRDEQCKSDNSMCSAAVCTCKHYYAQFNSSTCVESQMLGHYCKISEQCSLRVANSVCKNEICQCLDGFFAFRKHTCLKPAKLGEVCYSDDHCQLWNKNSQCKFLIPKLFGKCICPDGGDCIHNEPLKISEKNFLKENNGKGELTETNDKKILKEKAQEEVISFSSNQIFKNPFNNSKTMTTKDSLSTTPIQTNNTTKTNENLEYVSDISVQEVTTAHRTTEKYFSDLNKVFVGYNSSENNYRVEENQTEISRNNLNGISLGFPCKSDVECQKEDAGSKCFDGICDCVIKNNVTESCGREHTGCGIDTFQCKSSGICISWFFVCDGREDCPDKSDEDCKRQKCPERSFQCGNDGICVSLAVLCDGVKNCPNGEDEQFCSPNDRNATQGCPPYTFQCNTGECLPNFEFCNAIPKCRDGSDEPPHLCSSFTENKKTRHVVHKDYCPFRCENGRCRSTAIVCSGKDGCGDNSDEVQCTICRCPKIQHDN